ncbi:hypothetical protein [Agaribacter marinus]|uniref:Uncharacterized protein n=1 Tax=Agaribacter marinus TaxID=1431249 RepID=A0AA37T188_9ALTE|nr:hypothetical protein [Agaribacter marinus]GLR71895.1 hypothetical protein GCM10007852_28030 [Agaribacter marinus]
MKAKSGKVVKAVAPIEPEEVFEADAADPGKAAKAKATPKSSEKGKYDEQKVKPFKPPKDDDNTSDEKEDKPSSWVEFSLKDEASNPVSGQKYEVELPDGSIAKGTTDSKGNAKIEGFEPGECKLSFPDLHKDAW